MNNFRFILEPYRGRKTRYTCPNCDGKYEFTRYIDVNEQSYLASHVGICNNKNKCGYHYAPKQYFEDIKSLPESKVLQRIPLKRKVKSKKSSDQFNYYSFHSINNYSKYQTQNQFLNYFTKILNKTEIDKWIKKYHLGTYNRGYLKGSIIFWQIDLDMNIRTGKIINYDKKTGKRIPKQQNWYHTIHKKGDFYLRQVPFGLHLLKDNKSSKIAIVESEKTACIMSTLMPKFIWLAVGGCQNLNSNMFSCIKCRDIILFPDAGKYDSWKSKMEELPANNFFEISDLLHINSTAEEKKDDFDIADYALQALIKEK
ncbi:MAG: DUF6371 domain-containing protein [Bacteroidota bacterium]